VSPAGLDLEDVKRGLGAAVHPDPWSQAVGWKASRAGESVGRCSGRVSVEIERRRPDELRVGDLGQTTKVGGHPARHVAQRQAGAVGKTGRSSSLADDGHDPLREPGS
jgi:Protein of unknown function (DUF3140)